MTDPRERCRVVIRKIVARFESNACRALHDRPDVPIPELGELVRCLAEIEAIDEHAVRWDPLSWSKGFASQTRLPEPGRLQDAVARLAEATERPGGKWIVRRGDVFELGRGDVIELFLATMAWGYGRGWGWWRTAQIIEHAGQPSAGGDQLQPLIDKLNHLANLARSGPTTDLFSAWSDATHVARLVGLGPAFATKFAYFAGYDRQTGRGPLIADLLVAWAMWALADVWDVRHEAPCYAEYLAVASRWAEAYGCRPDEVERALFSIGPAIRAARNASR